MKQQDHSSDLLPLRSIRADQAIQQRAGILNNGIVAEYTEAMKSGATFPPVVVFHDADFYWLADGYHRLEAADEAGRKSIEAEIRAGTKRDAILFAVGANRDHGLRRTRDDVRRAISTLVTDAEWGSLSDRAIAEKVGCSPTTVGTVRAQLSKLDSCQAEAIDQTTDDLVFEIIEDDEGIPASPTPPPAPTPAPKRIGKDGKARAMPKPTAPPTKPTPPRAPTKPTASPALVAMQQAHAVKDCLVVLERVEGDLLPEDGHTLMANLRAALERLEARFGGDMEVRDA